MDSHRHLLEALDVSEADGDGLRRNAAVDGVSVPAKPVKAAAGGELGLGDELGIADRGLVEGHGVDGHRLVVLGGLRRELGHRAEELFDRRRLRAVAVHVTRGVARVQRSAARLVVRIPRARRPPHVEATVAVSPSRDVIDQPGNLSLLSERGGSIPTGARREDATAPACVETAAKLILRRLRLVLRSPLGAFRSAVRAAPAVRASVCHRASQWISLWRRRRSAAASSAAQLRKLRDIMTKNSYDKFRLRRKVHISRNRRFLQSQCRTA